jgi:hypothetical protein
MIQTKPSVARRLPGWIASGLMIFFTTLWTFWGIAEMYHEGWWGPWYNRLPYLAPIAATLIPTLVSFKWPIAGGVLIILVGVFALVMFGTGVALIGLFIALVGVAFVVEGMLKRRESQDVVTPFLPWWRRNLRYLLLFGLPAVVSLAISLNMLPIVLTRLDDGDRGARLIEGNGVTLVWAPEGPGWNWQQPWGGYPSWQSVALYGMGPVGFGDKPGYGRQGESYVFATVQDMATYNICRYLGADGLTLMEEIQDIWRMPTTNEVVRSLGRHGENAGCEWSGDLRTRADCDIQPDKESPLWATDHAAIYYWTADDYSDSDGYFVAFNGAVNAAYKPGGNPRHSYRCVRDP